MNKINKLAVILFGLILPAFAAQADITSDLASDTSYETVIRNGLNTGLPMSIVLVKIFSSTAKDQRISILSAAITVSPNDIAIIVRAAIRAGADPEEVVTEAVALSPLDKKIIAQAAISSGADVMDVTLASAAGIARSGLVLARGGALGALPAVSTKGTAEAIVPVKVNGGGARAPVTPPSTSISPS